MRSFRTLFPSRSLAVVLVAVLASLPLFGRAAAAADRASAAEDPRIGAMLGSGCPPSTVARFTAMLVLPDGDSRPLADHFTKVAAATPRFEAADLTVDVALPQRPSFRVEGGFVALEPSSDGASLHFEVAGPIFGAASRVSAAGTIQWGKGPRGGDKLIVDFAIDDADVNALRVPFPERFDPAIVGPLDLSGHGEGVVGEISDEDAPASPLKGKLDGSVDWVVLGRRAPLVFSSAFSIDDQRVRLSGGHLASFGLGMDLSGWFSPYPQGDFRLAATFADVDAAKVATDWQVPPPWQARAILSGKTEFWGKPGASFLSYEAKADDITVPGLGGYTIRTGPAKLAGRILGVNTDANVTVMPTKTEVGAVRLDNLPFGVSWWRDQLSVTASNTQLWGGNVQASLSYVPANHPAFELGGLLQNLSAPLLTAGALPGWNLGVDGTIDVSFRAGQRLDASPYFSARSSVRGAKLAGTNVIDQALAALAASPTPLAAGEVTEAVAKLKKKGVASFDNLFVEIEQEGDGYLLGGILVRFGDLRVDGGGRLGKDRSLDVAATLYFPPVLAQALVAKAHWAEALKSPEGGLYVPLHLTGPVADIKVTLPPSFIKDLAEARAGRPVTPAAEAAVEHIATSGLAVLADDPEPPSNP